MMKRETSNRYLFFVLVVFSLVTASPSFAQDNTRRIPENKTQINLSFAPLVKEVRPAVVNIYTKIRVRRSVSPFMSDPFFEQFFGRSFGFHGMPRERLESSLGSGVIIRDDGMLVTNAHVIDDAEEITVALSDGREYEADVILIDEPSDLALIQIHAERERFPYVELAPSETLEVGDLVLAIGNPFGVGQTVTSGIVSAQGGSTLNINDFNFFIQTDAAINPGNSGGPLVAMDGRVVGINSAIFSKSGGSLGIGFAIPSEMVMTLVAAADDGQRGDKGIVRPWLGVSAQKVTSDIAASLDMKRPVGVLISSMHKASPAKQAGLKSGDIVKSINGRDVREPTELKFRMATVAMGDQAEFVVLRDGREKIINIKAMAPPEIPPRDLTVLSGNHPLNGIEVANVNPALSVEYGLGAEDGIVVTSTRRQAGGFSLVRPGDLIREVNGQDAENVDALTKILKEPAGKGWEIIVERRGRLQRIMIR